MCGCERYVEDPNCCRIGPSDSVPAPVQKAINIALAQGDLIGEIVQCAEERVRCTLMQVSWLFHEKARPLVIEAKKLKERRKEDEKRKKDRKRVRYMQEVEEAQQLIGRKMLALVSNSGLGRRGGGDQWETLIISNTVPGCVLAHGRVEITFYSNATELGDIRARLCRCCDVDSYNDCACMKMLPHYILLPGIPELVDQRRHRSAPVPIYVP